MSVHFCPHTAVLTTSNVLLTADHCVLAHSDDTLLNWQALQQWRYVDEKFGRAHAVEEALPGFLNGGTPKTPRRNLPKIHRGRIIFFVPKALKIQLIIRA